MKKILSILLLLVAIPSQAEIISRNLVGTAADIIIIKNYQAETGTGEVLVQLCPSCTSYKLILTSKTEISRDSAPIQLAMLKTYLDEKRNALMRLQFNKNTNQVVSIALRRNNKEYPE